MDDRSIKIDGVSIASPTSIEVTLQDIDSPSTTRTSSGKMVRQVVRGGYAAVRVVSMKWERITGLQLSVLLRAVGKSYFTLTYPDPRPDYADYRRSGEFYVGDRKCTLKRAIGNSSNDWLWSVEFNCIEV